MGDRDALRAFSEPTALCLGRTSGPNFKAGSSEDGRPDTTTRQPRLGGAYIQHIFRLSLTSRYSSFQRIRLHFHIYVSRHLNYRPTPATAHSRRQRRLVGPGRRDILELLQLLVPRVHVRERRRRIHPLGQEREPKLVPRNEGEVGDRRLVADEPARRLGLEDVLEDGQDALDLGLVAGECVGDLLGREEGEVGGLAEVGALAGGLEEELCGGRGGGVQGSGVRGCVEGRGSQGAGAYVGEGLDLLGGVGD